MSLRRHQTLTRVLYGASLLLLIGCFSRSTASTDASASQSPAAREFSERVHHYVEVHRRLEKELPPVQTKSADEIKGRQHALAESIRQARPNAEPGDIFTPPVVAYFRRAINADVKETGTAAAAVTASEKPDVGLRVNREYPGDQPLSTVPPILLSRLPALPEEVEYRFVGPHLLLLDRNAQLIVDYLPNAGPPNR